MKRYSLTLRLALLFAAASAAVLLVVGSLIWRQIDEHFEQLDLAELHGKLELVSHALSDVRSEAEWKNIAAHFGHGMAGHGGVSIAIYALDGRPVYLSPGVELPARLLAQPEHAVIVWESGGERFRGMVAQVQAANLAQPPFKVALALNLAHHADFIVTFRQTLAWSLAFGIILTSLLGWFVARRGLQPLRSIAGLARNISAERLHDRLDLSDVPHELVDLGEAFNAMLARLEDSFRRLSDFSSDIAHELRTPISNLMVQTQVAISKARSAEEYRETLYSNLEEYERLTRMVSDMLFIAQADNGLIVPLRVSVNLANEVDSLFEFYQALAEERGVTMERLGEIAVVGESSLLRRALANLLANAIRYTSAGGGIRIVLGGPDGDVVIENMGEAIAPEHLPRLFDRFYRADPSRHREGESSGLGLAIVKSIVDAHGGSIEARCVGGWTRFVLHLPVAAA